MEKLLEVVKKEHANELRHVTMDCCAVVDPD